ncbi:putative bZIP transcription factor superfamily protein isoform X1 [Panicum miliaceum]|uniref:BZIP transcription factor superfamily protein isoform X1 n=1 Tax=Panicum miliaceum TaxID=4540 RepID=A0A3L6T5C9_PANMI|nr:putative bZIP transcription factor superfamily protein isoform X1 [Panicum miliaceum]
MASGGGSVREQQQEMNISFGMMNHHHGHHHQQQPPSSSSSSSMHAAAASFMSGKEASGAYDHLGELDQALFMYLDHGSGGHGAAHQEQRQTLNIFPSQPMHVEPSPKGEISLVLSPAPVGSKQPRSPDHHHHQQAAMEELAGSRRLQQEHHHLQHQPFPAAGAEPAAPGMIKDVKPLAKKDHRRGTSTSERDPKTLRRLAQNREAARKSRLRKKAYIQQLESSRIRLAQLEQELHTARAQGVFFPNSGLLADQGVAGKGVPIGGIDGLSSGAASPSTAALHESFPAIMEMGGRRPAGRAGGLHGIEAPAGTLVDLCRSSAARRHAPPYSRRMRAAHP